MLLASDSVMPSVAGIVTGRSIRGSWWSDASAREIFAVLTELEETHELTFLKLVAGKVTILHRRLEPALLAIATSGEEWQRAGLPPLAAELLDAVEREGSLRLDRTSELAPRKALASAAAQIERRLLAFAGQEHTERGAHERTLTTWRQWARERELDPSKAKLDECKRAFEDCLATWPPADRGASLLPWNDPPSRRTRPRSAR